MAIRKISTSSAVTGVKSNKFWDQSTDRGALVPIGRVSANGTSGSMSFTNIPQNFTDLMIVVVGRSFYASATTFSVYLNGTGYIGWSQTSLNGSSTSATSGRQTTSGITYGLLQETAWASTTADVFSSSIIHLMDYSSTSKYKTGIAKNAFDASSLGMTQAVVGTWQNLNAITNIDCATNGNWMSGSYATLYGIKAGN